MFLLDERELVLASFLRQGHPRPELQAVRRRKLPTDTFQDGALGGPLREPARFQEVIAELRQAADTATGGEVTTAALVLPDRWLRLTFAELEDAPRNRQQREEALRFKLRKQVPFRVEELRVRGARTGNGVGESSRFLIAFCVERVLAQIEDSFRRAGVHIGMVTNASLGTAHGIRQADDAAGAFLLLLAHHDGYSLLAHTEDDPALYRYKNLDPALSASVASRLAVRELRLTRSFIEERKLFGPEDGLPAHVLMLAAETSRPIWRERLEDGLGLPARVLGEEEAGVNRAGDGGLEVDRALPMLGAALTVRT